MKRPLVKSALVLAALSATPAIAATAYVSETMTIHAGPDATYPALERLSAETRLWVHGCRAARDWCDVSHGRMRGWVPGSSLALPTASRAEDIPVVRFELERYWSENYTREPFYAGRATWADLSRQVAARPTAP